MPPRAGTYVICRTTQQAARNIAGWQASTAARFGEGTKGECLCAGLSLAVGMPAGFGEGTKGESLCAGRSLAAGMPAGPCWPPRPPAERKHAALQLDCASNLQPYPSPQPSPTHPPSLPFTPHPLPLSLAPQPCSSPMPACRLCTPASVSPAPGCYRWGWACRAACSGAYCARIREGLLEERGRKEEEGCLARKEGCARDRGQLASCHHTTARACICQGWLHAAVAYLPYLSQCGP